MLPIFESWIGREGSRKTWWCFVHPTTKKYKKIKTIPMDETWIWSIIAFWVNDNSFIHKSLILNPLKSNKFEFGRIKKAKILWNLMWIIIFYKKLFIEKWECLQRNIDRNFIKGTSSDQSIYFHSKIARDKLINNFYIKVFFLLFLEAQH